MHVDYACTVSVSVITYSFSDFTVVIVFNKYYEALKLIVCFKISTKYTYEISSVCIHVKSPSLGGRLPLFDPISLLDIHLPPRRGKLPLFWPHLLRIIFSLKRVNCIEFPIKMHCLVSKVSIKSKNTMFLHYMKIFKPSKGRNISSFQIFWGNLNVDGWINVAVWLRAKSPPFLRSKQGDLPLLNFSNLTCMCMYPWLILIYPWILNCTNMLHTNLWKLVSKKV